MRNWFRISQVFSIINTPHSLSVPTFTFPLGGEILSGNVTIEWVISTDSWEHSVSYNISYSPDNGTSWISLTEGLNGTSFVWDTTTVSDGDTYLLKIEAYCSEGQISEYISTSTFEIQNETPTEKTEDIPPEIYIGVIVVVVALGGGFFFIRRRRNR